MTESEGEQDNSRRRRTQASQEHNRSGGRSGTDHNHVHPLLVSMPAAGTGQDGRYDKAIHHCKHGCRRLQMHRSYSMVTPSTAHREMTQLAAAASYQCKSGDVMQHGGLNLQSYTAAQPPL